MPKNTENTNLKIIIYSSPDMQAPSAGTVAGPSLHLPRAAGRCVPSLACLELSGRKAPWDCASGLRTAPLSSAPPGMWHQPPRTVASLTPVSSTSTTPSASLSRLSGLLRVRKPEPGNPPSRRALACLCGLRASPGCRVQGPTHGCAGASVLSVAASVSFSQSEHSVEPVGRFPVSIP